jgi:hypothetical protein
MEPESPPAIAHQREASAISSPALRSLRPFAGHPLFHMEHPLPAQVLRALRRYSPWQQLYIDGENIVRLAGGCPGSRAGLYACDSFKRWNAPSGMFLVLRKARDFLTRAFLFPRNTPVPRGTICGEESPTRGRASRSASAGVRCSTVPASSPIEGGARGATRPTSQCSTWNTRPTPKSISREGAKAEKGERKTTKPASNRPSGRIFRPYILYLPCPFATFAPSREIPFRSAAQW